MSGLDQIVVLYEHTYDAAANRKIPTENYLTNRQDWSARESVQRGLGSPFAAPGPLSPDQDTVYSFVTTMARGYLGARIGEWPPHGGSCAR